MWGTKRDSKSSSLKDRRESEEDLGILDTVWQSVIADLNESPLGMKYPLNNPYNDNDHQY